MVTNNAINTGMPIEVEHGGSGNSSLTAYAVLCGGVSATAPIQPVPSVGTAGQILTSNGPGALPTFQAGGVTLNFHMNKQVFTTNALYIPTSGMQYCEVICLGGGGGGGATYASVGSGGGAGEYAVGVFSAATIGSYQTITIGAGGVGGPYNSNGGYGGTTSLGALISAVGGEGGLFSSSSPATPRGGRGGSGGSGGSFRCRGMTAPVSVRSTVSSDANMGCGANSQMGSGAWISASTGSTGGYQDYPINPALGYGSGGSGNGNFTTAIKGGNGAPGIVIITEYIFS